MNKFEQRLMKDPQAKYDLDTNNRSKASVGIE